MGVGLDNWEQVAEMRAACRELTFADEEGRENEVWLDYNADLVSRSSDVCTYDFSIATVHLSDTVAYVGPNIQLAWEEEQRRRRAESKEKLKATHPVMVNYSS